MKDFSWLPPLIKLSDCSGDTLYYIEVIYKHFVDNVVNSKGIQIFTKTIGVSSKLEKDGKHERFWHVITDPHNPSTSAIKYTRAEKITWIRPVLENYKRTEVLVYSRKKKGKNRLCLFIPDRSYIVVLEERKTAYNFITAYHIDYSYKLNEYLREYDKYGPKTKTAP